MCTFDILLVAGFVVGNFVGKLLEKKCNKYDYTMNSDQFMFKGGPVEYHLSPFRDTIRNGIDRKMLESVSHEIITISARMLNGRERRLSLMKRIPRCIPHTYVHTQCTCSRRVTRIRARVYG